MPGGASHAWDDTCLGERHSLGDVTRLLPVLVSPQLLFPRYLHSLGTSSLFWYLRFLRYGDGGDRGIGEPGEWSLGGEPVTLDLRRRASLGESEPVESEPRESEPGGEHVTLDLRGASL